MNPVATILIPTHDHGPTLRASVASALRQTMPVEVFVVGDGVPDETRAILREIVADDKRVRFFDHPKGVRRGEAYRHEALQEALGSIVCYLADDDLYLPRHVEEMSRVLEHADFANAIPVEIQTDGTPRALSIDLAIQAYQQELLEGRNRIPLSAGAHTLAAYRALEEGWSPAPAGTGTDLHMWRKFLRHPGCRFRAAEIPTVLVFPSTTRLRRTPAERLEEMQRWLTQDAAELNEPILAQKIQEAARLDARVASALGNGGILTPWEAVFQVFFPVPSGYNEQDSAHVPVRFKTWQTIRLNIPCAPPQFQIRIDPANTPCLIELARLQVRGSGGELLWSLRDDTAHTIKVGGTAAAVSRGPLIRLISDGDDPQIALPPLATPPESSHVRLEATVRLDADVRTIAGVLAEYLRVPIQ
jgi:hypothetical protein